MPVTPFHFGPAAIVKGLTPRYFSFTTFGLSQVVIDLEPLYFMVQGSWPIHRFFHSYIGATIVAVLVGIVGKPLAEGLLRWWNLRLDPTQRRWLGVEPNISLTAALTGALFGGWSHVLIDSVMHADMQPLSPFSAENSLLYVMSINHVHWWCVGAGVVGGILLIIVLIRRTGNSVSG